MPLVEEDETPLRRLLQLIPSLPEPWNRWSASQRAGWSCWAKVDLTVLQWQLHRQPLEPLVEIGGLLHQRGAILIGEWAWRQSGASPPWANALLGLQQADVQVELSDSQLSDALPLYAPLYQPLPNSPQYGDHLLDHSRRLVLGQIGLTVVLMDDLVLRKGLASGLAAEFGSRVVHESTTPDDNGVVCGSWSWWLEHQNQLPSPCQVVVALLPIASLEDPLTAARVALMRQRGGDWFRNLLLPEAINRLQLGLSSLRQNGGRLAVLDGRLRSRSWGQQVLAGLRPWVQLKRLLPE